MTSTRERPNPCAHGKQRASRTRPGTRRRAWCCARATAATGRWRALPVSIGVTAFVEPTRAGPRVSTVTTLPAGDLSGVPQAMLVGPDRDVLVVLDGGRPVGYSPTSDTNRTGTSAGSG